MASLAEPVAEVERNQTKELDLNQEQKVRRSTRSTAGKHSNPYNLPYNALNQEVMNTEQVNQELLLNISRSNMMLGQLLLGIKK